ncbi:hypothetical protein HKD21_11515 [Gluconobacter cerevisiae]|uniref:Phage tail protein n=2 Tax=Gluconobacter TaxID=441 RepID=A0ABR9YG73_9PROT|nr:MULTISPECIES: hypothetical protein [Gluconobacter]MBF0877471.1 hypothetical protein [Gluconobacter cerevisiae]GBR32376.1 Mu-like bacteriophage tail protein GpP [Gluconobacter kondonii NBRC 3266]GLQ65232.1 tail protein [Gluconobacter kondonii]
MSTENITVTGNAFHPPDMEFHIYVGNRELLNYTSFQFNRSMEQLPGNFTITIALAYARLPELLEAVQANQKVTFYIAKKLMFTGILERVDTSGSMSDHPVVIQGRSALRDLFDCSAMIPGYVATYKDLNGLAQTLCSPFGVKTYAKSGTSAASTYQQDQLSQMNLNAGETPYAILQRAARIYGKILYDSVGGALVIADVADGNPVATIDTSTAMIEDTSFSLDISGRFSEYVVAVQPNDQYSSGPALPIPTGIGKDPQQELVGTQRKLLLINSLDSPDHQYAQNIAQWQANRNYGRSMVMNLVMTGYQSDSGDLWDINTLVSVTDPLTGIKDSKMIVAGYTMIRDLTNGSTTQITLMPREAFSIQPNVINPSADYYNTKS